MKFAFVLFKYFPFGGLQRDFSRIAEACISLGHQVDVYSIIWEGPKPDNMEVHVAPIKAFSNHQRNILFTTWLKQQFQQTQYDAIVGFNKLEGLDVYYAADPCYQDKALTLRHPLYRLGSRYKHFYQQEKAVFSIKSHTEILMISEVQKPLFQKHYHTPEARFHLLPPGISKDRKAPVNAAEIRANFRQQWNINDNQQLMLMVGSGFKTKGLDRALLALASLPDKQKENTHFIVIGQDNPKTFLKQASSLGITKNITILKGRNDIPDFLLGADLLIHPAYNENTGTILLEAVVAGLPVLVTDVCGYAHYISEANAGVVLNSPFNQPALNTALSYILTKDKSELKQNALNFASQADIYDMPKKAAQIIEDAAHRKPGQTS
ncbi:MAG: glucosyltransferase I RfaG [Moraxellaceae bacterium]|nr:MAG: glucosyltransferase I RfaG [Moraxellaceae bacterium]